MGILLPANHTTFPAVGNHCRHHPGRCCYAGRGNYYFPTTSPAGDVVAVERNVPANTQGLKETLLGNNVVYRFFTQAFEAFFH